MPSATHVSCIFGTQDKVNDNVFLPYFWKLICILVDDLSLEEGHVTSSYKNMT